MNGPPHQGERREIERREIERTPTPRKEEREIECPPHTEERGEMGWALGGARGEKREIE